LFTFLFTFSFLLYQYFTDRQPEGSTSCILSSVKQEEGAKNLSLEMMKKDGSSHRFLAITTIA